MMLGDRALTFLSECVPTPELLLIGGPVCLLWAYACLSFAAYLKEHRGFKTGYSRKAFHFLIFFAVALIHRQWGTSAVCVFGVCTTLVIFYALLRGDGHPLYEAMAREKDAPHRTRYIVAPYCATLVGGLAGNILFGEAAVFGYLVTGLGDAVGEPVGTRWGRHEYRVPTLSQVKSTRSLEGSAAVFVACLLAVALAVALSPEFAWTPSTWLLVPCLALICTGVEAISPHGWDNATMQVIPSLLARHLL
jgi:phytol kinase